MNRTIEIFGKQIKLQHMILVGVSVLMVAFVSYLLFGFIYDMGNIDRILAQVEDKYSEKLANGEYYYQKMKIELFDSVDSESEVIYLENQKDLVNDRYHFKFSYEDGKDLGMSVRENDKEYHVNGDRICYVEEADLEDSEDETSKIMDDLILNKKSSSMELIERLKSQENVTFIGEESWKGIQVYTLEIKNRDIKEKIYFATENYSFKGFDGYTLENNEENLMVSAKVEEELFTDEKKIEGPSSDDLKEVDNKCEWYDLELEISGKDDFFTDIQYRLFIDYDFMGIIGEDDWQALTIREINEKIANAHCPEDFRSGKIDANECGITFEDSYYYELTREEIISIIEGVGIVEDDWKVLSNKQINERLEKNGQKPILDKSHSWYEFIPEEMQKASTEENQEMMGDSSDPEDSMNQYGYNRQWRVFKVASDEAISDYMWNNYTIAQINQHLVDIGYCTAGPTEDCQLNLGDPSYYAMTRYQIFNILDQAGITLNDWKELTDNGINRKLEQNGYKPLLYQNTWLYQAEPMDCDGPFCIPEE